MRRHAHRWAGLAAMLLVGATGTTAQALTPPPALTAKGETLAWSVAGTQNSYKVLARTPTTETITTVIGRVYTPKAIAGVTVSYRVKAAFNESAWSNAVSIEYPAQTEEPPPEEEPEAELASGAGNPKYRLDAATYFDPFATSTYASWVHQKIAMIKGYPPASNPYVSLFGVPLIGYHDPATEGFSPLTASSIESYVARVRHDVSAGYDGTFIDDVNWSTPFRDGKQSTALEPEKRQLANLIEAVRAADPNGVIEINSQFRDLWPLMKAHDPIVERALRNVDVVTKEFGVGPTAGIGTPTEYAEYLSFVDALHAKGIEVTMTGDPYSVTVPTMEYNMATYLLVSSGGDYVNGHNQTPTRWWKGFNVKLGEALGPRERSPSGVWSRHFTGGVVYAVEPGAPTQTIVLGQTMSSAEWGSVKAVTLTPREGAVFSG